MFHGFIPHIMGTRFDILLIHSDIDRLNTLWADIAYELERLPKTSTTNAVSLSKETFAAVMW